MGAFYNSICLAGPRRDDVASTLERWLVARGFERSSERVLFDLDADQERSAFLLSHRQWTVLLYSEFEEERRLIHELRAIPAPLLYLWVFDSSSWGYDLFEDGLFLGSYSSDPKDHESFDDIPVGSPRRPWASPVTLANALRVPERVDALAAVHSQNAVFKEDVCRALCVELGVEAAMFTYDDLDREDRSVPDGWTVEQVLFVRSDSPPVATVDLHAQRVTHRSPTAGVLETGTIELSTEVLTEIRRTRRRQKLTMAMLRPLGWLVRSWRTVVVGFNSLGRDYRARRQLAALRASIDRPPTYQVSGDDLLNERHGCRIRLPPGVLPAAASSKPASVFAFLAGGVHVTCTARPRSTLREILRRPDGSDVAEDGKYHVGSLQARHLLFRLPAGFRADTRGRSFLGLHVVQAPQAFYVFLYRYTKTPSPAVENAIERVVMSFRFA